MISNSGHDENGKISGGRPGDQTGSEWEIREWYKRPWSVILRHPNLGVRETIADLAEKAATNERIGYDQRDRLSYWAELKKADFDPSKIDTPCSADCSAGVAANVKAAGYILDRPELQKVEADAYTGNLRPILKAAGFDDLTDDKYLTSPDYLLRGDILLYEGHHVATNLTDGVHSQGALKEIELDAESLLMATTDLTLRDGPGVTYDGIGVIEEGEVVVPLSRVDNGSRWWVKLDKGYLSLGYLRGWVKENGLWWYSLGNGSYDYYKQTVEKINGKFYAFDEHGWMITADRIGPDGAIN